MLAIIKTALSNLILPVFSMGACAAMLASNAAAQTGAWLTHSHDDQHTGLSTVQSQSLSKVHWQVPVDLAPPTNTGINVHYGSPLVTAANTVIVPVKTRSTVGTSFRVEAHNGATGQKIWTLSTRYYAPNNGANQFIPGLGPTISGGRLFVPDIAGAVLARANPDEAVGKTTELYFYGQQNYLQDPTAYQKNVQIDTPLTTDAHGNLYFGFLVEGSTPLKLQSGLARIAADGTGTWVSAAQASGDPTMTFVNFSAAPALSLDGSLLYVAVSNSHLYQYANGYLLALDSATLTLVNKQVLLDPSNGQDASISPSSSAVPTVGPDGDVYFGVLEASVYPFPAHNYRGWLLHFNRDLSLVKIPGSFGWDDTPSIVPASLVATYHGTSSYLVMTKYNNYLYEGSGDGKNKIAILDPNATEHDPIISSTLVMKEVLTILGPTKNPSGGVYEWCINTAAVDPFTKSVLANSADGNLYRWDLTANKLTEKIRISSGYGEAYTPTLIGTDGTAYAINDAKLDAIGN